MASSSEPGLKAPGSINETGREARLNAPLNANDVMRHEETHMVNRRRNEDSPTQQQKSEPPRRPQTYWNPFWLSRAFLVGFATITVLLAAATLLVWRLSDANYGFPVPNTSNFAWTYGPTAVLVIFVSLWRQSEYWCRLLQPWQELRRGPASAQRTVLLDHISPMVPVVLWRAVRLRHGAVLVSLVGGFLLRLTIIASTGLLIPTQTQMPFENTTLESLTGFSAPNNLGNSDSTAESAIDYEAYALLAEGLPFPEGLQAGLVYQRLALPSNSSVSRTASALRAIVDVFQPQFDCENALVTPVANDKYQAGSNDDVRLQINTTAAWPSCMSSQGRSISVQVDFIHAQPPNLAPRQLYGTINRIDGQECAGQNGSYWGLITLFDIRYNQSTLPDAVFRNESHGSSIWETQIMPVTAVACHISYSMKKAQVTYDLTQSPPRVQVDKPTTPQATPRLIAGFDMGNFSEKLVSDAEDANLMVGNYISNGLDMDYPSPFFKMMSVVGNASYETFLGEPGRMADVAISVLGYLAVQVANYYVTTNASAPVDGQVNIPSLRLQVSALATGLMFAGFVLVAAGSLWLFFIRPDRVVPCRMDSISGTAMVLSESGQFQDELRAASGPLGLKTNFISTLQCFNFGAGALTTNSGRYGIYLSRKAQETPHKTETSKKKKKKKAEKDQPAWWQPFSLHPASFILVSAFPLALVAVLIVLQRLSTREGGIAAVNDSASYLTVFSTRFIPAFVFWSVAALYNDVEFNVLLLSPFYRLKKGNAKAGSSITISLLGQITPQALYSALRHGHWAAAFAVTAAFVGSFLTPLVSGLYIVEVSPGPSVVDLQRIDQFDPTWPDSVSDDGGAAVLLSDFAMLNLSYPPWTSSELAVPKLQLSLTSLDQITATDHPAITVRVPAMRADLNCTALPLNDTFVGVDSNNWQFGVDATVTVNSSTLLPTGCGDASSSPRRLEWSNQIFVEFDTAGLEGWIAQLTDLHVDAQVSGTLLTSGERNAAFQKDNPPGCPSLAFTFGNYSANNGPTFASSNDFTTLVCYQLMTEVQTDVTLTVPNFTVISAVPDESTVSLVHPPAAASASAFQYRPQVHFDLQVALWNEGNVTAGGDRSPSFLEAPSTYDVIDGFFALLLEPRAGTYVDPWSLQGTRNVENLVQAVRGVHRRYMAQVASAKMRVPAGGSLAGQTVTGTWVNSGRGVVRQNGPIAIALGVLLAFMCACGICSYVLLRILGGSEVLPYDPCSIASLASLLAGSALCDTDTVRRQTGVRGARMVVEDADWTDDKAWDGWTFSLGWWMGFAGAERRFGINAGQAQWDKGK